MPDHRPGLRRLASALASLKLTIALLAALMVAVAGCTLAQARMTNHEAVARFISSFWITWRGLPVFPGGALLGLALLVNLSASQLTRLELSRRKAGLWLCHLGLIALFGGEFVASFSRHESLLALRQGQTLDYAQTEAGQRVPLGYDVTLLRFTREVYPGTDIPKSFSSRIQISGPGGGDSQALISMNNPLRFRGRSFYQASYADDGAVSILEVVDNPGWAVPYAGCLLVGLGLLLHFFQRWRASGGVPA